MSEIATFSFDINPEDSANWEKVISVLEAGHAGYRFQMAMDVFGKKVTRKLDRIVENESYDNGGFIFMGADKEGRNVTLRFDMPADVMDEFKKLFKLCPVANLTVDVLG